MIDYHRRKKAFVTMGLYEYSTKLPYGFKEIERNNRVKAWQEKPDVKGNINIGCYVMEPGVLGLIPEGKPYGMDMVIRSALAKRNTVAGNPIK